MKKVSEALFLRLWAKEKNGWDEGVIRTNAK
jgi:hypothetical protein